MGWGRMREKSGTKRLENINFSTAHMGGYYRNLGKFYDAVLLVGFVHLLKSLSQFDAVKLERELIQIEGAIAALDRWPEVVTFEEMNLRPPSFLMFRAMREVMQMEGHPVGYGQILNELKFGTEVRDVKDSRDTEGGSNSAARSVPRAP